MLVGLVVARFLDTGTGPADPVDPLPLLAGALLVVVGAVGIGYGTIRYRRIAVDIDAHRRARTGQTSSAVIASWTPSTAATTAHPRLQPDQWRLRLDGLLDHPAVLSLNQLQTQFGTHTLPATLQCAGARRADLIVVRDLPGEAPWGPGATSTARWTGVALADVLAAAGLQDDAAHLSFEAPDLSQIPQPPQTYGSSIPRTKATGPEVLLAWAMNDQPLPAVHGGPVRIIVPGYIGARSVKWVNRITAQKTPSSNYFQATAYRLLPAGADPATAGSGDGLSVSSVALSSDILNPQDGATVSAGQTPVSGYAYAGDNRTVVRVDVSTDHGASWQQADLDSTAGPWTWTLWHTTLDLRPGTSHVIVRAWDSTGATQPEDPAALWNSKSYINNSWDKDD